MDRFAGVIQEPPGLKWATASVRFSPMPTKSYTRHVKWLRAGLGFIFGNHFVHFFHVGGCRIVFEKRCIAVR